jgi:XTP/dITP diphosphohydrolase
MKLVVATRNDHKLGEIRAVFAIAGLELVSLAAYPDAPEVDEDKPTFEGNAVKKAVAIALATGEWAMSDDSGLEVTALDGRPGVWSARYAGEPVDHSANNAKLLSELNGASDRSARFCCVIAISSPTGVARTVVGTCEGTIAQELSGDSGFGYDPLFVPDGYASTFAAIGIEEKNRVSHRARALHRATALWNDLQEGG